MTLCRNACRLVCGGVLFFLGWLAGVHMLATEAGFRWAPGQPDRAMHVALMVTVAALLAHGVAGLVRDEVER